LSVGALDGQRIELFGRTEAFVSCLKDHLLLLDHVHEFHTRESPLSGIKCFEPQHGAGDPLDGSMVLLNDIVEILDLADDDSRAVLGP
jgi:hypothetical protein